ncbi:MAG: hypothetical protein ACI8RZ_006298, partial [Myxococcota bacterium]
MLVTLLLMTAQAAWPTVDIIPHRDAPQFALLHANLIPLGFSPSGRMAILYLPPDEAIGCFLWELRIIDLVTDKPLHTEKWQMEDCETINDVPGLLAGKGARFTALLAEHNIQREPATLHPFPARHGSDTLMARLITGPISETEGDTFTAPVRVVVQSAAHGEKDIGILSIATMMELPMTWGHEVLGYIPAGDRVVVVRELHRGWEGLPVVEVIH